MSWLPLTSSDLANTGPVPQTQQIQRHGQQNDKRETQLGYTSCRLPRLDTDVGREPEMPPLDANDSTTSDVIDTIVDGMVPDSAFDDRFSNLGRYTSKGRQRLRVTTTGTRTGAGRKGGFVP